MGFLIGGAVSLDMIFPCQSHCIILSLSSSGLRRYYYQARAHAGKLDGFECALRLP